MLKFIDKGINFNALKGINGNEELIEIIRLKIRTNRDFKKNPSLNS